MPVHYYAMVKCVRLEDGYEYYTFCGKQGSYRKMGPAIAACKRHQRIWKRALSLRPGVGRAEKLRLLNEKAKAGRGYMRRRILSGIPIWAKDKVYPALVKIA